MERKGNKQHKYNSCNRQLELLGGMEKYPITYTYLPYIPARFSLYPVARQDIGKRLFIRKLKIERTQKDKKDTVTISKRE